MKTMELESVIENKEVAGYSIFKDRKAGPGELAPKPAYERHITIFRAGCQVTEVPLALVYGSGYGARESCLIVAVQMLKHLVSRELPRPADSARFWQPRYYDFNVYRQKKWCEKLRYLHRNPVSRGLVTAPEEWKWSSFRHWLTGEEGTVEIESHWTFQKRERMGMMPRLLKQPFVGEREVRRNDVPSHPALSPNEGE